MRRCFSFPYDEWYVSATEKEGCFPFTKERYLSTTEKERCFIFPMKKDTYLLNISLPLLLITWRRKCDYVILLSTSCTVIYSIKQWKLILYGMFMSSPIGTCFRWSRSQQIRPCLKSDTHWTLQTSNMSTTMHLRSKNGYKYSMQMLLYHSKYQTLKTNPTFLVISFVPAYRWLNL